MFSKKEASQTSYPAWWVKINNSLSYYATNSSSASSSASSTSPTNLRGYSKSIINSATLVANSAAALGKGSQHRQHKQANNNYRKTRRHSEASNSSNSNKLRYNIIDYLASTEGSISRLSVKTRRSLGERFTFNLSTSQTNNKSRPISRASLSSTSNCCSSSLAGSGRTSRSSSCRCQASLNHQQSNSTFSSNFPSSYTGSVRNITRELSRWLKKFNH